MTLIFNTQKILHNDKLHKIGIKASPLCTFCESREDSIEHMLFTCATLHTFWDYVRKWLAEIGYEGYIILIECIILGDVENNDLFSYIKLICKKIKYGAINIYKKHTYNKSFVK